MALFNGTTDQFRQFVSVTINFSMDNVLPELLATENRLLCGFLGEAVAEQIVGYAEEDPGALDRFQKNALYLARVAVGRVGFAQYLPFAEVQIGDDGITVSAAEGRKAAFEYQTNKLEKKLLEEGWRALDELITLVARATETFTDWAESPYYEERSEALFATPAEFSKYYPIQDRWLTFWALRPFIRQVEEERGWPALTRLQAQPDDAQPPLRRRLLRALAYQSIIEALPNLSIELNGVNVQVNYASQYGNAQYYQAPNKDHLTWVLTNLQKQCDIAWNAFESSLNALDTTAQPDTAEPGLSYSTGAVSLF